MSNSHFDEIATVYDESLPAHVVEHYLRKRTAFYRPLPPAAPSSTSAAGPARSQSAWPTADTRSPASTRRRGCSTLRARRCPAIAAVEGSGTALPFDDDSFDLVLTVATLHHIAEPAAVRQTLVEMMRVCAPGRPDPGLGSQPAQPVLEPADGPGPPGHGRGAPDQRAEIVGGAARRPGRGSPFPTARAWSRTSRRRGAACGRCVERVFERTPTVSRLAAHNVVLAGKPAAPAHGSRGASSATIRPSGAR